MAKIFESEFGKGIVVAVIDNGDYQYQTLVPLFNEYGYGFVAPDKKLVFIDGQHDPNTQKIVEAHEVGHIVMGHGKHSGPLHEAEADTFAIMMLRKFRYGVPATKLLKEFKGRHGYDYNHSKNVMTKINVHSTIKSLNL